MLKKRVFLKPRNLPKNKYFCIPTPLHNYRRIKLNTTTQVNLLNWPIKSKVYTIIIVIDFVPVRITYCGCIRVQLFAIFFPTAHHIINKGEGKRLS